MSTPTTHEVKARLSRPRGRTSLAESMLERFRAELEASGRIQWPSDKYRTNPVGFARDILGDKPWAKQVEILETVRDHKRVAVSSGHKIGKSRSAVQIALWFYCSFPDARVVMSSTTSRQVDQILWRELRMLHARAAVPLGGEIHELARSGLKAADFREIIGFTAREAEAVAGISGPNLLYILDEASGIPQAIFEAIEGNRAGGARLVMFSNPTKTEGEFFDAFHAKAEKVDARGEKTGFYRCIRVSSEETPNAISGKALVPGLATKEWIDEKREEWGPESALYKIRVRGEFVLAEEGKILSAALLTEATKRWEETKGIGRLRIGLDPAGPGEGGDESVFAVRRGEKILELHPRRGLNEDGHLIELLGLITKHRDPREPAAIVTVDSDGPIGSALFYRLRAYAQEHVDDLEIFGVRASDRAVRRPDLYPRVRDELWANLEHWIRSGGAIPDDAKLAKELHAPEWIPNIAGQMKVTPKSELRKQLDRSPDRADAIALAVWDIAQRPHGDGTPRPAADVYRPGTEIDAYELDGLGGNDPVYG